MNPLLLIPGMMCDERMWGGVPVALRSYPHAHAIPSEADNMSELAEIVLRDAPPKFALAGLSMGGIVAMEILARAPERVERLALLDTNPKAELPEVKAKREPQITKALTGRLASVMRFEMKPHYLVDGPAKKEILDLCMDMAMSLGPDVFARQSRALRDRKDRQEALAAFKGPALVLMGAQDRLCPRDRHELMHRLMPQSKFEVIEGAAHLPPLEKPVETAAALRRWLEE